jgi:hypothetical protein
MIGATRAARSEKLLKKIILEKEATMYISYETILILLLIAFIIGLVIGVSLTRPRAF